MLVFSSAKYVECILKEISMTEGDRLKPPNILLGVTGSINIAAIAVYISALQNELHCRLHLMMTPAAMSFIPPTTLMHLIDGDVFVDLSAHGEFKMPHVELTHWADAAVILPTSANTIAKIAHGFAQDIVSSTLLAASCKVALFPSMYVGMWQKRSVQRNIQQLREDGYYVYPYDPIDSSPEETFRESDTGILQGGGLPNPQSAAQFVAHMLSKTV